MLRQTSNNLATRPLAPSRSPADSGGAGARRAGEEVRLLVCSILDATWYQSFKDILPELVQPGHSFLRPEFPVGQNGVLERGMAWPVWFGGNFGDGGGDDLFRHFGVAMKIAHDH